MDKEISKVLVDIQNDILVIQNRYTKIMKALEVTNKIDNTQFNTAIEEINNIKKNTETIKTVLEMIKPINKNW